MGGGVGSVSPDARSGDRGVSVCGDSRKARKGNYHLHVAWCGRVNVGIVRKMWLAALGGGKGCGNIDAKKSKSHAAAIGLRGSRGTFRSTCPNISRTIRATTKSGIGQPADNRGCPSIRDFGGYVGRRNRDCATDARARFFKFLRLDKAGICVRKTCFPSRMGRAYGWRISRRYTGQVIRRSERCSRPRSCQVQTLRCRRFFHARRIGVSGPVGPIRKAVCSDALLQARF